MFSPCRRLSSASPLCHLSQPLSRFLRSPSRSPYPQLSLRTPSFQLLFGVADHNVTAFVRSLESFLSRDLKCFLSPVRRLNRDRLAVVRYLFKVARNRMTGLC